jgi:hypothetical protein
MVQTVSTTSGKPTAQGGTKRRTDEEAEGSCDFNVMLYSILLICPRPHLQHLESKKKRIIVWKGS